MKHTGSTLAILLFIGLSYFILPHSLQVQLLPKKASADTQSEKITPKVVVLTVTPTPTMHAMLSSAPSVSPKNTPTPIVSLSPSHASEPLP